MGKSLCEVVKELIKDAVEALHTVFGLDSNEVAEVKGDLPNV
mgnify:CR=1 FL=1